MPPFGATVSRGATHFRVRSPLASALWLCLFNSGGEDRIAMQRQGDDWLASLPGDRAGRPYGYRAEGAWQPDAGHWFDPAKLLVDPHAIELDRRFVQHPDLARFGVDTGPIVPRALVPGPLPIVPHAPPLFAPGGLIYEINVRGFSVLHPDVPAAQRGWTDCRSRIYGAAPPCAGALGR